LEGFRKNFVDKPIVYGIPIAEEEVLDQAIPAVLGISSSDEYRKQIKIQKIQDQLEELYQNLAKAQVVTPIANFNYDQF
jgi:hypothetical protein